MHTRNTLVMAIAFILLGGFVYFYEIRGRADRTEAEREASLLMHFEAEDVAAVEVTTPEGSVTAEKTDGVWAITAPAAIAADGESLDALVDNLMKAGNERLIVEAAEDLSPYGLDEPDATVSLTLADGTTQSLSVGGDTPVGFNLYTSPGDGAVYSAARTLREQVKLTLHDLRDRSLLAFEESEVERAEITASDFSVSLRVERGLDDDTWFMTAPTEARADSETVEDLLSSLHSGEAEAFVLDSAPSAEQLQFFGLTEPRLAIALWTPGDISQRLLIGTESTIPAGFYAMREGGSAVFVVPADLVDDAPASLDDLRNKQVLALARENIHGIELVAATGRAHVQREGSDWRITAPGEFAADASAVSSLLSALQDLRAEGFAAPATDPGAATLTVNVELRADDEAESTESVQLRVGRSTRIAPSDDSEDAEEIDARLVTTSADSTVYIVPAADIEDLEVDVFELRDKTLVQFNQADLTSIELSGAGFDYRLEKEGEAWRLSSPTERELTEDPVSDLLWDVNYLRMEAVADATMGDTTFGLSSPRFHLVASSAEGVVADVAVGADAPVDTPDAGGRVYVRVAGHEGVFEVSASLAEAIQAIIDELQVQ